MSSRTAERLGWIGRLVSPRWDRRGCAARVDERRTEFVGSEKIEIRYDVWIGVSLGHRVGKVAEPNEEDVMAGMTAAAVRPQLEPLEHETIKRVAWRLIPVLMLGYFCAYLDRVNVGFAKLTMQHALNFS